MSLYLQRPLAILDLETTGQSVSQDRIVEIAIIRQMPDGSQVRKRKLINPQMIISPEVIAIHGITNEMVKDAPTFKQVANEIKQFLDGCDVGGYNSNRFDLPLLIEEFHRAGMDVQFSDCRTVDVQRIFYAMEQRTLSAAYKFYCNKELIGAHGAEADASATLEVLIAQTQRYPQLGNSLDTICRFAGEEDMVDFARRMVLKNGKVVFNFGKHLGKPVAEVLKAEPTYYDWMMKSDFSTNTKRKLTEVLNRSYGLIS